MTACKLGIESYDSVFQYLICEASRCPTKNFSEINLASPEWMEYNKTLCDIAEGCKKACGFATEFFSCVNDTFCTNASAAVKEMGRTVYMLSQESDKASALAFLPWAAGITFAGFGIAKLIDTVAPKNRGFTVLSYAFHGVGALGAIGLWHSGRTYYGI